MTAYADRPSAAHSPEVIHVRTPITLGQFLKVAGIAQTGGEAKLLVVTGRVVVNGDTETKRGRHLKPGDEVVSEGRSLVVSPADPDKIHPA